MKSSSATRGRSAGRTSMVEKFDKTDSLDGSYLEVSGQQSEKSLIESSVSKKRTKSKTDIVGRSVEDEKILEILKKAVSSTPVSRGNLSTLRSTEIATPKSAKKLKKPATPKSEQSGQKFTTPSHQKNSKLATASKESRLSRRSLGSSVTKVANSRKTLGLSVTEAMPDRSLSRQSLLTPLSSYQSGKASASRIRNDSILSRDFEDWSDRGQQLKKFSSGAASLNRQFRTVPQAPEQGQSYRAERSFSQYVEYHAGSGIEKYGAQAVEHTMGDQMHRAGGYYTGRKKGSEMEIEREGGQWEEENANNSADSIADDPITSTSTTSYSSRCTIL